MKLNIILAVIVLLAAYATCKTLRKDPAAEPVPEQTPAEYNAPGKFKTSRVIQGSNPDSAGTYQVQEPPRRVNVPIDALPPASSSRRAFLSTGWWNMNLAFQPSDTTVFENYRDKWLKFRENMTFDVIKKGVVLESGRWNWDEDKSELYLSCRDPYLNNTWAVKDRGFVMIWTGNTALNVTGIQARVVGSRTEPPVD